MLIGVLAALMFLVTFANTRERVLPPRNQATNLRRDLLDLLSNGPWLLLSGYSLVLNLAVAVRGSVSVHYIKYYLGEQTLTLPGFLPRIGGTQVWQLEELVAALSVASGLASVCGVVLLPAVTRVIDRKPALITLLGIVIGSMVPLYWVRPDQVGVVFALTVIGTLAGAPLSALIWSMYADTVDYAELKTRRRATGLVFATVLFASKQGWALGAILALGLMSSVGFVANTSQSPQSLRGLLLLSSLIPAGLCAIALLFIVFYPLNEERVARIGRELAERRAADAQGAAAATRPAAASAVPAAAP
jgi:GPH family glycoside/pentoside/hexuronide:cation symporter